MHKIISIRVCDVCIILHLIVVFHYLIAIIIILFYFIFHSAARQHLIFYSEHTCYCQSLKD